MAFALAPASLTEKSQFCDQLHLDESHFQLDYYQFQSDHQTETPLTHVHDLKCIPLLLRVRFSRRKVIHLPISRISLQLAWNIFALLFGVHLVKAA